jgi:RNA polymerase sigma-70 factor (ECF subfamily)
LFELALSNPDVPHAELAERSGISLQRLRQALCEVRARLRQAVNR